MRRDAPELDAAFAPLARRGAPAGFATRLLDRYQGAIEARRRRTALLVSAGSIASLASLVTAGAVAAHLTAIPLNEWLGASVTGLVHGGVLVVHATARVLPTFTAAAVLLMAAAAATAACCVVLATLVRDHTRSSSPVQ